MLAVAGLPLVVMQGVVGKWGAGKGVVERAVGGAAG